MSRQTSTWQIARASAAAPDPSGFDQKAAAVGAGVANAGWATILVVHGEAGMSVHVTVPAPNCS